MKMVIITKEKVLFRFHVSYSRSHSPQLPRVTVTVSRWETYSVQHLEHSVLLAGVQPVDDDHQPCLVLSEAVDGLRHPGHQFHLALQDLAERTDSPEDTRGSARSLQSLTEAIYREESNPKSSLPVTVPLKPQWVRHKSHSDLM